MNTKNSYSNIVVKGSSEDKTVLFNLFKQRAKGYNSFSKVEVRKQIIREFMDSCIYNEANKKMRELSEKCGWHDSYYDKQYYGLRIAIFHLGFTFDQIDEIKNECIKLAHKYFPEKPEDLSQLKSDSVWLQDLELKRIDELEVNQKFRWFKSDEVPIYIFKDIDKGKIFAEDLNKKLFSWHQYDEFKVVYVNKN